MIPRYQKRHIEDVAEILRIHANRANNRAYTQEDKKNFGFLVESFVQEFADLFSRNNPRFDRDRFFKAIYDQRGTQHPKGAMT